jgi:transcriptional antiterminator
MNHSLAFQQLTFLQELIEKKRTGSPKELAKRLNISERTVYRKIKAVENVTFKEVAFCSFNNSYCFKDEINSLLTTNGSKG